ncbi:hypothetical protein CROQUDRAFT_690627 [Cronartium quercuum f. sp. fusiforme G11]|uniref:Uncharacterized protein n=1 Tax=Cronartium quercuum f. sp. fusiforme G11 TaxID=708437 RepID=A0A9P6N6D6_9BASI|nr:hypothetical protein CROQUDRAFT_690627 [Cronartium quercuum f. sp. fusiforme G11]
MSSRSKFTFLLVLSVFLQSCSQAFLQKQMCKADGSKGWLIDGIQQTALGKQPALSQYPKLEHKGIGNQVHPNEASNLFQVDIGPGDDRAAVSDSIAEFNLPEDLDDAWANEYLIPSSSPVEQSATWGFIHHHQTGMQMLPKIPAPQIQNFNSRMDTTHGPFQYNGAPFPYNNMGQGMPWNFGHNPIEGYQSNFYQQYSPSHPRLPQFHGALTPPTAQYPLHPTGPGTQPVWIPKSPSSSTGTNHQAAPYFPQKLNILAFEPFEIVKLYDHWVQENYCSIFYQGSS